MKQSQVKNGMVVMLKNSRMPVQIYRKMGLPLVDASGYVYLYGGPDGWVHVTEIRPLTAKEKGLR